jgi:hypothetical protein
MVPINSLRALANLLSLVRSGLSMQATSRRAMGFLTDGFLSFLL